MPHGGQPAGIQTVCSSLVQGEVALGLGDLEVLLGVWQCVRLEQKHVGMENNKLLL